MREENKMYRLKEDFGEVKEKFPESKYCYQFLKDDEMIGIASINQDEENNVYIFIKKELRGNGYGKLLFSTVLQEMKEKNYEKAIVQFDKKNIQMMKIVTDNHGQHISTDAEVIKYLIPIH